MKKEAGLPKPWSEDKTFQTTYFCNVHREDDTVTKFIRKMYSPYVMHPWFEVNIVFSRLVNWPHTLEVCGFCDDLYKFKEGLERAGNFGREKVWGDAYIVSTNGHKQPKAQYVLETLLPATIKALGTGGYLGPYGSTTSLAGRWQSLCGVYGLASFMAGQIIADLKNTPEHPLSKAADWGDWACPGPGSLRGISWIYHGHSGQPYKMGFMRNIKGIRDMLEPHDIKIPDLQDLQNCLCEFDKWKRVSTGVGRSKRSYPGV